MSRGFDGFEIDDFRDSDFGSGRDVGQSSTYQKPNGVSEQIPLSLEAVSILLAARHIASEPEQLVFATPSGRPLCRRNLLQRQLRPTCTEQVAANNAARFASLSRDVVRCRRSATRYRPGAARPRFAGDHTANLAARDSGRATQSSGRPRETSYWTQIDPSFGSRAKAELVTA